MNHFLKNVLCFIIAINIQHQQVFEFSRLKFKPPATSDFRIKTKQKIKNLEVKEESK